MAKSDNFGDRLTNLADQAKFVKSTVLDIFRPENEQRNATNPNLLEDDKGHFFGDSKLASQAYDLDKRSLTGNVPRFAWQYFAQIQVNSLLASGFSFETLPRTGLEIPEALSKVMAANTNLSPLVKRVDMPSMSMAVSAHNAYNRRRVSQSKIKFEPLTLVMHDVVSGVTLAFWELYYKYYFFDGANTRKANQEGIDYDITPETFVGEYDFGLALNGESSAGKYLIDHIDIFQIHAGKGKRVRLIHPLITKFEQTQLAYGSEEISELTFTFEYEYAVYQDGINETFQESWDTLNEYYGQKRFIEINVDGYDAKQAYDNSDKLEISEKTPPGIGGWQGKLDQISGAISAVTGLGRSVAGEVAKVSSLGNQFNKLQEDLLGKRIIDIPTINVRDFTAQLSKIDAAHEDLNRARSTAETVILGNRNVKDPISTTATGTTSGPPQPDPFVPNFPL